MTKSKLLISAAGSGKTSYLVKDAIAKLPQRSLVVTYTNQNKSGIINKIKTVTGRHPNEITVLSWFSFLLTHLIRPYQGVLSKSRISGLNFVQGASGLIRNPYGKTVQIPESNFNRHFLDGSHCVYSDKIAKLAYRCIEKSKQLVISRLNRIYSTVYIDEIQDLSGYDLDVISSLIKGGGSVVMVGDPRQTTYSTHHERKNRKYSGRIDKYIEDKALTKYCAIDRITLSGSHRNNQYICDFSSRIYPNEQATQSLYRSINDHQGLFVVSKKDINKYCAEYSPVHLRYNSQQVIEIENAKVFNFGESKGLTFNRVIIYPTKNIENWLLSPTADLKEVIRAKFYVAVTRARDSVAFVVEDPEKFSTVLRIFQCI